ncbi:hypothetical protein DFH06DRAFT_1050129 [Mycena polygramma]|nr:hypothetical protein DFH06DRAFT_1050129 [Mycena polygramma]
MDWASSILPLSIRKGISTAFELVGLNPLEGNFSPFECSLDDLLATRDILLHLFPLELVYIILDLADRRVRTKSVRAQHAHVAAARWPDNNASLCYLLTPPMLNSYTHNDETIHLRISSVEFTTSSHDQGWCSEAGLQGTYAGHSWFEASIMRPGRAPNADTWITLAEDGPVKLDPKIQYDPMLEVPRSSPNNKTRWMVQRNLCAHREFREHVVTWGSRTVARESDTGAGDGAGFVTQLRAGDRIAVIARAQFPGWTNVVERVDVSVSYSLA